jgi:hypothetical protein
MEKEPETKAEVDRPEPPPFDPDPDLITHLERGEKPSRDDVRAVAEQNNS